MYFGLSACLPSDCRQHVIVMTDYCTNCHSKRPVDNSTTKICFPDSFSVNDSITTTAPPPSCSVCAPSQPGGGERLQATAKWGSRLSSVGNSTPFASQGLLHFCGSLGEIRQCLLVSLSLEGCVALGYAERWSAAEGKKPGCPMGPEKPAPQIKYSLLCDHYLCGRSW